MTYEAYTQKIEQIRDNTSKIRNDNMDDTVEHYDIRDSKAKKYHSEAMVKLHREASVVTGNYHEIKDEEELMFHFWISRKDKIVEDLFEAAEKLAKNNEGEVLVTFPNELQVTFGTHKMIEPDYSDMPKESDYEEQEDFLVDLAEWKRIEKFNTEPEEWSMENEDPFNKEITPELVIEYHLYEETISLQRATDLVYTLQLEKYLEGHGTAAILRNCHITIKITNEDGRELFLGCVDYGDNKIGFNEFNSYSTGYKNLKALWSLVHQDRYLMPGIETVCYNKQEDGTLLEVGYTLTGPCGCKYFYNNGATQENQYHDTNKAYITYYSKNIKFDVESNLQGIAEPIPGS